MSKQSFKSALSAEASEIDALILSIQRSLVEINPAVHWVESIVLEHRLYAAMGRREGILKAIYLWEAFNV